MLGSAAAPAALWRVATGAGTGGFAHAFATGAVAVLFKLLLDEAAAFSL